MDAILDFLQSVVPQNFDAAAFIKAALFIFIGLLIISAIGRLFFGKKSTLNHSISSAISILFIYAITVVIHSLGVDLNFLLSPLPFVTIDGDFLSVFLYEGKHYTVICSEILSMVILSFLANLSDSWLPSGKRLFSWFFFRCISVLLAMILHLIASALLAAFLPEGLLTWAPVVLLCLLGVTLFMGLLKLILGALLSTVSPTLGIFASFFFCHVIGKQITRAVLTTALMTGIVWALNYTGFTSIFIASSALTAYIPFLIILLIVWYITGHVL